MKASFLRLLVPVCLIVGLLLSAGAIWKLTPLLTSTNLAFGPHVLAMFVPAMYAITAAILATASRGRCDWVVVGVSVGSFLLLSSLFMNVFGTSIEHTSIDDSAAYSRYARAMIAQGTLQCGNDTLVFYLQPGFRYIIAATILIFGDETRLSQLAHLFILLGFFILLVREVALRFKEPKTRTVLLLLCLGYAPFAIKSCLMSYSEWLTVALFALFTIGMLRERYALAMIPLALTVFMRQNLVLIAGVMHIYTLTIAPRSKRLPICAAFWSFLLLPLYHNVYYAGEWRFFATHRPQGALTSGNWYQFFEIGITEGLRKLPHYLGIYRDRLEVIVFGLTFAPASTALLIQRFIVLFKDTNARFSFITLATLTVGPTSIAGWGNFPRFVFVNLAIMLLCTWIFHHHRQYLPFSEVSGRLKRLLSR